MTEYSHFEDESFSVINQVFHVSGQKIGSILIDDQGLRFLSLRPQFAEDFEEAWHKKWSLATKRDIKYSAIRSITKEDQELKIRIVYRTYLGISNACEFSFFDAAVCAAFLAYMEKEQYFTYTHGRMQPFKAVSPYVLGLLFTMAMTWFCLYLVADQQHGGTDEGSDVKARLFLHLLRVLGKKGVLVIGVGICGYIGFKIWKRASHPPYFTRLVRV